MNILNTGVWLALMAMMEEELAEEDAELFGDNDSEPELYLKSGSYTSSDSNLFESDNIDFCTWKNSRSMSSRWNNFMDDHKILQAIFPYLVGAAIGLLPIFLSFMIFKFAEVL